MVRRKGNKSKVSAWVRLMNVIRGLPERSRTLVSETVSITPLWMMVFLLVSLGLFYQHQKPDGPQYKTDQVARSNIRAMVDLDVPDWKETDRRRDEARSAVLPVYDLDSRALETFSRQLHEFFASAREVLTPQLTVTVEGRSTESAVSSKTTAGSTTGNDPGQPVEPEISPETITILKEIAPFAVDDLLLSLFIRHEFSRALESALIATATEAYRFPFVEERESLVRLGSAGGVTVRNMFTTAESRITNLSAIMDRDGMMARLEDLSEHLAFFPETEKSTAIRFLAQSIIVPLTYNRNESRIRQEAAAEIPVIMYRIPKHKIIVREGDLITEEIVDQLEALNRLKSARWGLLYILGIAVVLVMVLVAFLRFVESHRNEQIQFKSLDSMLFMVLTLSLVLTELAAFLFTAVGESLNSFPLNNVSSYFYMAPFAFGSLLLSLLTTRRAALLFAVAYSLLAGLLLEASFDLVAYSLAGNFAAIYGPFAYTKRTALIKSGIFLGAMNALVVGTLYLLKPGMELSVQLPFEMACGLAGGVLSVLLVFIFLPLFEAMYHLVTDIRLLELSNLDAPLLRELALRAPGTYHHSVIVSHLAETAAKAIGANPLFVRVAAYYHDIGKMFKPEYFIENLGSAENKHDRLAPRMSSLILISHVKEGMEIGRKHNIVPALIDIIPQHHGTRLMTYFFNKAKEASDGKDHPVKESDYRYPGPKPQSNESAVIMLADAVEAASRTLTEPSPARLKGLVQKIVNAIVLDGQLDECTLTFKDLEIISTQFLRILGGIFHQRIDYPGFNFKPMTGGNSDAASHSRSRHTRGEGSNRPPEHLHEVGKGNS